MSNKEVSSLAAAYLFSFVTSALAAWAICAMVPTKLKITHLPHVQHRGYQINDAAVAVTSSYEDDALEPGMKVSSFSANI